MESISKLHYLKESEFNFEFPCARAHVRNTRMFFQSKKRNNNMTLLVGAINTAQIPSKCGYYLAFGQNHIH